MAKDEKPDRPNDPGHSGRDRVERLRRRLYARDAKTETGEKRTPLSEKASSTPVSWDGIRASSASETLNVPGAISFDTDQTAQKENVEPESESEFETSYPMAKKRSSFAIKFLTASFFFFILATGVAAYVFFGEGNLISPQNIDIEIIAPSLIDGGKEAKLQVVIRNRNQTALEAADVIIDYPEGARSPNDLTQELTHERYSLGDIASGQQIKHDISAVFYGAEGVEQTVNITLEYTIAGSNAIFDKDADATFVIGSSPVAISITSPSEKTSGEQVTLEVEVRSNSTASVSNVALEAQYPFGFTVQNTSPQAEAGGTFFRLGDMEPGDVKTVRITGRIEGQDGDERVFRFLTGSVSDDTRTNIEVPFVTVPSTLTVRAPFVTGTIAVEGQSGKTVSAPPGKNLQGRVTWQNNLSEPIENVELTLVFSGPALEEGSIDATDGFYQSKNKSLIWTSNEVQSLESVPPGGTGSVQFSFATKAPGESGVLITNPTIDITLSVRGVRGAGNAVEHISDAATTRVTLASTPSLTAQAAHFGGPFSNSGPVPPRAESSTTYSIIWTVNNPSNTVANASVSTTLPPYVEFVTAQGGTGITYDEGSRTVRWNMNDLKAGAGYTLPARQAAFQIRLTPSTSQVGQAPVLTGKSTLSGQDRFAQTPVNASAPAATTNLSGENGFSSGMDIVQSK